MKPHAFVAMPFGKKPGHDGELIDFNAVYSDLLKPAAEAAGLEVFRADEELAAGDIKTDMFQELLIADLVIVDLTLDNPNVWYELGVRHALRARGVVLVQGPRANQPFDIYTDRKYRYSIKDGVPDPATLERDRAEITRIVKATLESWHGRKISPVYHLLPNLEEPRWKALRVGDALEFWQAHDAWENRIDLARKNERVGDLLVLADEAPVAAFRAEARIKAGVALRKAEHFDFALEAGAGFSHRSHEHHGTTGKRHLSPAPRRARQARIFPRASSRSLPRTIGNSCQRFGNLGVAGPRGQG